LSDYGSPRVTECGMARGRQGKKCRKQHLLLTWPSWTNMIIVKTKTSSFAMTRRSSSFQSIFSFWPSFFPAFYILITVPSNKNVVDDEDGEWIFLHLRRPSCHTTRDVSRMVFFRHYFKNRFRGQSIRVNICSSHTTI